MIKLKFCSLFILLVINYTIGCKSENNLVKAQSVTNQQIIDDSADKDAANLIVDKFITLSIKKEKKKALELRAKIPSNKTPPQNTNVMVQSAANKFPSIESAFVFLSVFPLSEYDRKFDIEEFVKDSKARVLVAFLSPTKDETV